MKKFPPEIIDKLKSYVYLYIDPRTNEPFYVGKGVENRAFFHIHELSDRAKNQRIAEIHSAGLEPIIDILRYGLTDEQAAMLESSAIDLIGLKNLTNSNRGQDSKTFGRVNTDVFIRAEAAGPAFIEEPSLLIKINQLYRSDMNDLELYETTRGFWIVAKRRERAELGFAVYQGIILEVYRIKSWHPAGTLHYETRDDASKYEERWEFDGEVASDVRDKYIQKTVRGLKGANSQNPIFYVNC
jgi:hypothetical protein